MCICALGCQATKAVFDVCLCKLAHQAAGHFRPSWTNSWVPLKKGTALWPLRQADATSNKWHRYQRSKKGGDVWLLYVFLQLLVTSECY